MVSGGFGPYVENTKTKNLLVILLGGELMILRLKSTSVAHQERSENIFLLRSGDIPPIPRRGVFRECFIIGPSLISHCATDVQSPAIVSKLN